MARGGGAYAALTSGKGTPGAYNARRGAGSLLSAPFPRPCGRAGGRLGRNGMGRAELDWIGGGRRERVRCLPQVSPRVGKLGEIRPDSWKSEEQTLADEECNSSRRCGYLL
ncbi:uncharacterized protein VK521_001392 isoform 1-T1 [Ammospiza maritima maritima]